MLAVNKDSRKNKCILKVKTRFINNFFVALHFREQLNMLHLVHDLVVGSSQSYIHGVHQFAEFEVGWMSAILLLTLNIIANFSSLNGKRANRYPSHTSDTVVPFRFVVTLKKVDSYDTYYF